jgi:hypothetical protein
MICSISFMGLIDSLIDVVIIVNNAFESLFNINN